MKYITTPIVVLTAFFILTSCKKAPANSSVTPANLTVVANVNPDSSGSVIFTATAKNAVTYTYEFGNGVISIPDTSNTMAYQYSLLGTNTYTVTVTATGSTGIAVSKSIQITVPVKVQGPADVFWSDEFNVDGAPDPTKWGYDIGNSNGWGNNELEYYTSRAQNAVVQGGVLKITAIKESYNGFNYTSARLLSKGKFAFTYGTVEIRAKLPAGAGTWPAIWTLGSDVDTNAWPACGEMDIMEQHGDQVGKIYGTIHYPGHSGANGVGTTTTITDAATAFHIYKLNWTAATINMYVDDNLYFSFANTGSVPFNHDFFFILNVAMGGNFGGTVDPSFTSASMQVDYIRVYK
jgi:beta-glucanase (GH16 family)